MEPPTPPSGQQMMHSSTSEVSRLLPGESYQSSFATGTTTSTTGKRDGGEISSRWKTKMSLLLAGSCAVVFGWCAFFQQINPEDSTTKMLKSSPMETSFNVQPRVERVGPRVERVVEIMGKSHHNKKTKKKDDHHATFLSQWKPPDVTPRCEWVMEQFKQRDEGTPPLDLQKRYLAQSADPNVFYRATATIFWQDFAEGSWAHDFTKTFLLHNDPDSDDSKERVDDDPENKQQLDGVDLVKKNLWTWVTGDQHLSNFGAWRNRHGDVVFGVNDFDEAGIYDFQIDVVRIAVSIYSHAITNGFDDDEAEHSILTFTESYVKTVLGYLGNEDAKLFELTPKTAYGSLKTFLEKTEKKKDADKLITKFTTRDPITQHREFIKGPQDVPHEDTHLATVAEDMVDQIKLAFNHSHYGATMMKLGWAVTEWDGKFFEVLDVAERIGSGIGSFGVDRYYVLIKGKENLLTDDGEDGSSVILDVKFQPISAVTRALNPTDKAWYDVMFSNEAARVVEGQRRLTSYTDPFTGWVMLKNLDPKDLTYGQYEAFSVRQRSPWKNSPDLDDLTDPDDFDDFMAQIAIATATSHVRGSVAKAPGDFKDVIAAVLGGSEHKRHEWGKMVVKAARGYREQVLMDFKCFRDYVQVQYGSPP